MLVSGGHYKPCQPISLTVVIGRRPDFRETSASAVQPRCVKALYSVTGNRPAWLAYARGPAYMDGINSDMSRHGMISNDSELLKACAVHLFVPLSPPDMMLSIMVKSTSIERKMCQFCGGAILSCSVLFSLLAYCELNLVRRIQGMCLAALGGLAGVVLLWLPSTKAFVSWLEDGRSSPRGIMSSIC